MCGSVQPNLISVVCRVKVPSRSKCTVIQSTSRTSPCDQGCHQNLTAQLPHRDQSGEGEIAVRAHGGIFWGLVLSSPGVRHQAQEHISPRGEKTAIKLSRPPFHRPHRLHLKMTIVVHWFLGQSEPFLYWRSIVPHVKH